MIKIEVSPGADAFRVTEGMGWLGSDLQVDFTAPAEIKWSDVTAGDGLFVDLFGGAVVDGKRRPATWWTATGKGDAWAIAAPLAVRPRLREPAGATGTSIDCAPLFAGEGLAYSVASEGWAISEAGLLTGPTGAAEITVTATNESGSATVEVEVFARAQVTPFVVTTPPTLRRRAGQGEAKIGDVIESAGRKMTGPEPSKGAWLWVRDGMPVNPLANPENPNEGWDSDNNIATDAAGRWTQKFAAIEVANPDNFMIGDTLGFVDIPAGDVQGPPTNPLELLTRPALSGPNAVGGILGVSAGAIAGGVAPIKSEVQFRRGTNPEAWSETRSRQTVEADRASSITAKYRFTDSSTPPQIIEGDATGSVAIPSRPVEPEPGEGTRVRNSAELRTAMVDIAGRTGERVITLAPGNYGPLTLPANLRKMGLSGDGNGGRGIIRPDFRQTDRTPNDQRTQFLNGMWGPDPLAGLEGWTFDNIWWTDTRKDAQGYPSTASKSFNLNNPKNITWRNCRFSGQHRNIATHGDERNPASNIVFEWNEFTAGGMDSFSLYGVSVNCHVRNNWWHDQNIDNRRSREALRHSDASSMQGQSRRNCSYTGNKYDAKPGYWQCIFVPSSVIRNGGQGAWAANYSDGLLIARNWLNAHNWNGILVGGWQNVVIEDNVIRNIPGGNSRIVMESFSRGICRRNVTGSPIDFKETSPRSNWDGLDTNVISNTATPAALPRPEPHGPFGYEA